MNTDELRHARDEGARVARNPIMDTVGTVTDR
jgi:hypothetical protein